MRSLGASRAARLASRDHCLSGFALLVRFKKVLALSNSYKSACFKQLSRISTAEMRLVPCSLFLSSSTKVRVEH
jgi:hypothetical protein